MTVTMSSMSSKKDKAKEYKPGAAEMDAAAELVRMAKAQGLALTGPKLPPPV